MLQLHGWDELCQWETIIVSYSSQHKNWIAGTRFSIFRIRIRMKWEAWYFQSNILRIRKKIHRCFNVKVKMNYVKKLRKRQGWAFLHSDCHHCCFLLQENDLKIKFWTAIISDLYHKLDWDVNISLTYLYKLV